MKIVTYIIAGIMGVGTLLTTPANAQISDREAAAIALGAAAIIAGAAIASQHRRRERHHHYYPVPSHSYQPSLRYRHYEPMHAPSSYYHHPYRRHRH